MIKVIAEDFIKSASIETVLPLYQELVKASQQEALCISYDLFVDEKDPGHIFNHNITSIIVNSTSSPFYINSKGYL
ncbi:putative quinol monooxygenase [Proteus mirabilis]|uniref:putative quinol monooxygenase n=1 Tax=Proteus mirabilis TaxID=584 RepID=UPI00358DBE17